MIAKMAGIKVPRYEINCSFEKTDKDRLYPMKLCPVLAFYMKQLELLVKDLLSCWS